MGQAGREIVKTNVDELIGLLNQAVAAEGLAGYRYLMLSKLVAGPNSLEVAEMFAKSAQEEWQHMGSLMERVVQLGGQPPARPADWERLSYVAYRPMPENPTDLRRIIEDSLAIEREVIRFYQRLFEETQHADPVTARLVQEILAEEVAEEDDLERLLGK